MRFPTLIAAAMCAAGCAGQPAAKPVSAEPTGGAAAARPAQAKVIPERIKGAYKVVMRGDKKLYCSKEKATGSHVNFRTVCLTPEEYLAIEQDARSWKDGMGTITPPNELPPSQSLGP